MEGAFILVDNIHRLTDIGRLGKLNQNKKHGKAHPLPLPEPVDPGGGGQGEGRRRAAEAEPRPWDAAARRGQEQQGEGEHAAGDGHAAGQDQQDVRHVGQVQGETSLSGVDLESM